MFWGQEEQEGGKELPTRSQAHSLHLHIPAGPLCVPTGSTQPQNEVDAFIIYFTGEKTED